MAIRDLAAAGFSRRKFIATRPNPVINAVIKAVIKALRRKFPARFVGSAAIC
jgi:hypothetical protein